MPFLSSRSPLLCLLSLTLYLSGCAINTKQPSVAVNTESPSVLYQQHMDNIGNIHQFSVKSRLGIITNPKNHSARLSWQHTPQKDHINVYSPIGGKVANIIKTSEKVTLTDNGQKTIEAEDTESLTEKTLGFRLPLSGLSHWVLGKPSNIGLVNMVQWDANGRIKTMQQNGWDIQYQDYAEHSGYFLPRKVTLKNDKMTLKLVTDKWTDLSEHH